MDLMKKRWLILLASCFVSLCAGSQYAWSVFASPMAEHLSNLTGQEITSLAIVFTVTNSVGPITMIGGGFINDKLGPKLVLLTGGILFGLGMIGSGFATSVGMLIVCYGLGVGLGVGMVYGTIVSNAVKFFPDKSGLAGGLTTACYGGSSVLVPIIVTALLKNNEITAVFKMIGVVMMIIICASAFVIQSCPADFKVEGFTAAKKAQGKDYSYQEMLTQPIFYLMLLTLTCGAFAGMMIISQASPIAQKMMGFTPAAAAGVVSILALFNMTGRLVAGSLSDRIGAGGTLRITFVCSLIASVLLYFCNESTVVLFYVGLAVIGFSFGAIMGIYPGFTAQQFGRKNNSVNYGIMFIGFALAGLLGPMIMNTLVQMTGRYQPAFLVSVALAALGEVLINIFMAKSKKA